MSGQKATNCSLQLSIICMYGFWRIYRFRWLLFDKFCRRFHMCHCRCYWSWTRPAYGVTRFLYACPLIPEPVRQLCSLLGIGIVPLILNHTVVGINTARCFDISFRTMSSCFFRGIIYISRGSISFFCMIVCIGILMQDLQRKTYPKPTRTKTYKKISNHIKSYYFPHSLVCCCSIYSQPGFSWRHLQSADDNPWNDLTNNSLNTPSHGDL